MRPQSRSYRALFVVVALLLAGIVGVAGIMLVLQGQGDQGAIDQAPTLDGDVGTLRAGWGAWVIATYQDDPMTDEPMALAVLDGQGTQEGELSIGCAKGDDFLSVQWNQYLGDATSAHEVDVRVDGGAIADMQWAIDSDETATILHEEDGCGFRSVSVRDDQAGPRDDGCGHRIRSSVRFDITGIEEVVPLVQEHCGW